MNMRSLMRFIACARASLIAHILWYAVLVGLTVLGRGIRALILAPFLLAAHPKVGQAAAVCEQFLVRVISRVLHAQRHIRPLRLIKQTRPLIAISALTSVSATKVRLVLIGFILGAMVIVPLSVGIASLAKDLPHPSRLTTQDRDLATEVYDRNGTLLYRFYAEKNRTLVALEDLPDHIKQATIAIEDKHFYQHRGIDPFGIARAIRYNLQTGKLTGGSTITQQLIKNTLLTSEKTFRRKIREIILAFWAELIYPKELILKMYLNEVAYGGPAWGIRSASLTYFGKEPRELTLGEAAFLAGLPAAPTTYSPYTADLSTVKQRQKEVLRRMVEDRYITEEVARRASQQELHFATPSANIVAPHFVMFVRDELVKKYGERRVYTGGLKVTTTLDLSIQEMAQEVVQKEIEKLRPLRVGNGGVLITDPRTGEILAMVGSTNYFAKPDGNFNVTTALRQPGSAIKPITYAAAFKAGYAPATLILDTPVTFPMPPGQKPYQPINYDGSWHGPVTLRQALGNSYNIPAVKMLAIIGVPEMIKLAREMGITTFEDEGQYGLAITLGGGGVRMLDMTAVYGVLASGGARHDPAVLLRVEDSRGKVIHQFQPEGRQVLDPGIAFLLTDILSDNKARSQAFGPSSPLRIDGRQVAVKTGTSDNKRDNWTFGYTPSYVVGVWVGNSDNSPMHPSLTSGITGAAPIWRSIMLKLLADKQAEQFARPENVIEGTVYYGKPCKEKEKVTGCRGAKDLFVKGKPVKQIVAVTREQMMMPDTGEVVSEVTRFTDQFSSYATPAASPDERVSVAQNP